MLRTFIVTSFLFMWTTLMSPYVGSEEEVHVPNLDPVIEQPQKGWFGRTKDKVVGGVVKTAVAAKDKVKAGASKVGNKIKDIGILDKRILTAKAETKHWKKQAKYWQAQYESQRDADRTITESKGMAYREAVINLRNTLAYLENAAPTTVESLDQGVNSGE